MSEDTSPRCRRETHKLNWFGTSVYVGGALMRLTANVIERTADRVSNIAEHSKRAFERELDPDIDDARVIEEYTPPEDGVEP